MSCGITLVRNILGITLATYFVTSPQRMLGHIAMNVTGTMETSLLRRPMPTEMAELSLLLPSWQMRELANTADANGMTVGQLMRGFIQQILQPFPNKAENGFDTRYNAI